MDGETRMRYVQAMRERFLLSETRRMIACQHNMCTDRNKVQGNEL